MNPFAALLKQGQPVIMPGAHDALTARLIEDAGFAAYGIGGSAVAATQLALPDVYPKVGSSEFFVLRPKAAAFTLSPKKLMA
jgi:2-methylisocitrate lyase-like PEP mutase family enzyme